MQPYYEDNRAGIAIFNADCRDLLPWVARQWVVDLVLTDPPYGIDLDTDNSRFSGGSIMSAAKRGSGVGPANGAPVIGDEGPFDPSFLLPYGKQQIIWGWSHFPDKLPRGTCLVWVKRHDEAFGSFLSDAELAWMSKGHGVYCYRDLSNNAIAKVRVHPTQKPVTLMRWCLLRARLPKGALVLDPYMGSGPVAQACKELGYRYIGIELVEEYCQTAVRRLSQEVMELI